MKTRRPKIEAAYLYITGDVHDSRKSVLAVATWFVDYAKLQSWRVRGTFRLVL